MSCLHASRVVPWDKSLIRSVTRNSSASLHIIVSFAVSPDSSFSFTHSSRSFSRIFVLNWKIILDPFALFAPLMTPVCLRIVQVVYYCARTSWQDPSLVHHAHVFLIFIAWFLSLFFSSSHHCPLHLLSSAPIVAHKKLVKTNKYK